MNLGLKKKNAIVCASSQGLGKAAALDLAKEGVHLAICSRKLESIERAKEEILGVVKDAKILAYKVNLDSEEEILEFYERVIKDLGNIEILINNTGGPPPSTFEQLSDEDLVELVLNGSWKGKAGGYDLAGPMGEFATLVEGDESTVLGITGSAMNTFRIIQGEQ